MKYGSRGGQPVGIARDIMYENVMEKFQWGGMDAEREIYMDENNRRMATNIRLQMTNLAEGFTKAGAPERGLRSVGPPPAVDALAQRALHAGHVAGGGTALRDVHGLLLAGGGAS